MSDTTDQHATATADDAPGADTRRGRAATPAGASRLGRLRTGRATKGGTDSGRAKAGKTSGKTAKKGRGKKKAAPVSAFPALKTGMPTRRGFFEKHGWYETSPEPVPSSTRQTEALRGSVARRAGSERALILGIDQDTGEIAYSDPGSDYLMPDGPKSTSRVRLGELGYGKSTDMKCNAVVRPLLLNNRRVVQIDRKQLNSAEQVGEYTPLAKSLGVQSIRFATDGSGVRINVLDQRIAARGGADTGAGQSGLLRAILTTALERSLTPREQKALQLAHHRVIAQLRQDEKRDPDIRDLIGPLLAPDAEQARKALLKEGELREWGLDMAFALDRCVEEDLAGLIDGPTSEGVDVTGLFTHFDICSIPQSSHTALGVVMGLISTFVTSVISAQPEHRRMLTHLNTEEGWWLMDGEYAEVARSNIKLARSIGLINEFAFHRLSDVPVNSKALSIIKEVGTLHVYKQEKAEDAEAICREFAFPPGSVERLRSLDQGDYALWQTGRPVRWISQLRSGLETEWSDTDGAFRTTANDDADATTTWAGAATVSAPLGQAS